MTREKAWLAKSLQARESDSPTAAITKTHISDYIATSIFRILEDGRSKLLHYTGYYPSRWLYFQEDLNFQMPTSRQESCSTLSVADNYETAQPSLFLS